MGGYLPATYETEGRTGLERMMESVLASSLTNQRKVVHVELFSKELVV